MNEPDRELEKGQTPASGRGRLVLAFACLALAGTAAARLAFDGHDRAFVERFVATTGLEATRPLDVASLRLEPAADLAAAAALEIQLREQRSPEEAREHWLDAAQGLAVRSLQVRPGWPFHEEILAEVAYRRDAAGSVAEPRRWILAWSAAARGAPGSVEIDRRRAEACLARWSRLPESLRLPALEGIAAALHDAEFVSRTMGRVCDVLGLETAIRLVPDHPEPMRTAAAAVADRSLERAARLFEGADEAERRDRAAAMRRLEELSRTGREAALRRGCREFAEAYPSDRLDDPAIWAQAARLLDLWPAERGVWSEDPRAQVLRWLLARGQDVVSPAALRRILASVSEIPDPVRAQLLLQTSDIASAERLRGQASAAREWISYDLRAARDALRRGDPAAARACLERMPAEEQATCEVLLARRNVARASGDLAGGADLDRRLAEIRIEPAQAGWKRSGRVALCLDPGAAASLAMSLSASAPAIVAYGFGSSRTGTTLVSGDRSLTVPLEGQGGARVFWLTTLAGGPVSPGDPVIR